jgi:hypothetical protein
MMSVLYKAKSDDQWYGLFRHFSFSLYVSDNDSWAVDLNIFPLRFEVFINSINVVLNHSDIQLELLEPEYVITSPQSAKNTNHSWAVKNAFINFLQNREFIKLDYERRWTEQLRCQ